MQQDLDLGLDYSPRTFYYNWSAEHFGDNIQPACGCVRGLGIECADHESQREEKIEWEAYAHQHDRLRAKLAARKITLKNYAEAHRRIESSGLLRCPY